MPVAVHCRVFSGMFDEPFVKFPAACTVSVTAPPAVVRALTSRLTGADVNVSLTRGDSAPDCFLHDTSLHLNTVRPRRTWGTIPFPDTRRRALGGGGRLNRLAVLTLTMLPFGAVQSSRRDRCGGNAIAARSAPQATRRS